MKIFLFTPSSKKFTQHFSDSRNKTTLIIIYSNLFVKVLIMKDYKNLTSC